MKKARAFLFIFLFLIIAFSGCNKNIAEETQNIEAEKNQVFKTIATGSTQTNDVLIGLTPARIENNRLEINFVANTHSVDLSQFDLMKITTLSYDNKQIKPISARDTRQRC